MTSAEAAVWSMVRRKQFGHRFRRQDPLGPYIVDFVCHAAWLVIELDGAGHVDSNYDQRRDAVLGQLGYRVLRFWNNDLSNRPWVAEEIASWIADPTKTKRE